MRSNLLIISISILIVSRVCVEATLLDDINYILSDLDLKDPSLSQAFIEDPTIATSQLLVGDLLKDKDELKTCGQFIASRGFRYELHFVVTPDDYILQVYRIINPYAKPNKKQLKPFLLAHGFLESCVHWLFGSPELDYIKPWVDGKQPDDFSFSSAFHLANLGYDVWIANFRGTTYSTNHTYLNPYIDRQFWDFTFFEIALYDVPAIVHYMQNKTGQSQVSLVGHSQGTIQLFIHLSLDPDFDKNYDLIFLAAPIGFLGDIDSLYGTVPTNPEFTRLVGSVRGPFLPASALVNSAFALICQDDPTKPVCLEIIAAINGFSYSFSEQMLNSNRLAIYACQFDTTSFKNTALFIQSLRNDHIRFYDYGEKINLIKYNSSEPPKVPYKRMRTNKMVFISSLNDYLATQENVQKLRNLLKKRPKIDHIIPDPYWNHISYFLDKNSNHYFGRLISTITANHAKNDI